MAGTLVVVEGIDGGGKSTLIGALADALGREGHDVVTTREPTGGPHGRILRDAAQRGVRFPPEEELRLFIEDRVEHVRDVIRPALSRGSVVLQDRSFYSTAAYQGARGLDRRKILEQNRRIAPEPDVLLVIDLPVRVGLDRAGRREAGHDAFEQEAALQDIRSFFRGLPQAELLDGEEPASDVLQAALRAVRPRLPKW